MFPRNGDGGRGLSSQTDSTQRVSALLNRGREGTPKSKRSKRPVCLPLSVIADFSAWRGFALDLTGRVFASETGKTPLWRDNLWNRNVAPLWEKVGLGWATFQVMRRTFATMAREAGADPKVTADMMGHGIGVNLDEYTRSRLPQLTEVVNRVESRLVM